MDPAREILNLQCKSEFLIGGLRGLKYHNIPKETKASIDRLIERSKHYDNPILQEITERTEKRRRVRLPLIHSKRPGSLKLTNSQIAELGA